MLLLYFIPVALDCCTCSESDLQYHTYLFIIDVYENLCNYKFRELEGCMRRYVWALGTQFRVSCCGRYQCGKGPSHVIQVYLSRFVHGVHIRVTIASQLYAGVCIQSKIN